MFISSRVEVRVLLKSAQFQFNPLKNPFKVKEKKIEFMICNSNQTTKPFSGRSRNIQTQYYNCITTQLYRNWVLKM